MITWSYSQSVKRLDGWWSFTINFHLAKISSYRHHGSADISFFITHVTSCGPVIIGSIMLSVMAISLAELEIWSISIFHLRIMRHMIILLQSVTIQFRRLFWHISYNKVRQSNFITKYERLLLQSVSGITKVWQTVITKCVRYYKVQQLMQSGT